jgi:hypothetical protein
MKNQSKYFACALMVGSLARGLWNIVLGRFAAGADVSCAIVCIKNLYVLLL